MEFMTPVDKYMISGVHRIRIGSLDENEIVVRSPEMIGVQTEFVENGNGWIICDTGSRSLTVDGNLVQSGYKLKCGDIIELGALRIIYCVQIIGVIIQNDLKDSIIVNLPYLDSEALKYEDVQEKDRFFHRSPRNTKEPVIESVTIENPPAKQQIEKKPLLMVIGPTFTMMIPYDAWRSSCYVQLQIIREQFWNAYVYRSYHCCCICGYRSVMGLHQYAL